MSTDLHHILAAGATAALFASSHNGVRTIETLGDCNEESTFDLGSITKIVATTAVIMDLVEEGVITLDQCVSDFLTEWKNSEKSTITIRHLLQHRSGLREWVPFYLTCTKPEEVRQKISDLPLAYPVGTERHYSDLGFITLGFVIAQACNKSFVDVVQERVIDKYNLSQTSFARSEKNCVPSSHGDQAERQMVATGIPYPVDGKVEDFAGWRTHDLCGEINDGNAFHIFGGASSHAGLFSTAGDLLTFGEEIRKHPRFKEFTSTGPDPDAHLGFRSWFGPEGRRFFGHTGFPGVLLAIEGSSVYVLLTNRLLAGVRPATTEELWAPILKSL